MAEWIGDEWKRKESRGSITSAPRGVSVIYNR
jgi:hypothetical protein